MKIHAVPDKPAGITYSFLSGDHQARKRIEMIHGIVLNRTWKKTKT